MTVVAPSADVAEAGYGVTLLMPKNDNQYALNDKHPILGFCFMGKSEDRLVTSNYSFTFFATSGIINVQEPTPKHFTSVFAKNAKDFEQANLEDISLDELHHAAELLRIRMKNPIPMSERWRFMLDIGDMWLDRGGIKDKSGEFKEMIEQAQLKKMTDVN